ncbi:hypothetical protein BDP55DRAFT_625977 [Colletotrichum godetiae]|uniref:Uncharacterized protein n=1 Tax=Colletotrichum godetiae TaxID=1209918 RepID=A0AAJ0EZR5_9PEZI|nr:uncharacterized protein BDP55DRAFT_625977 [Colletotrichum godetiae]KAK1700393.1 hypothetical protein BDP55DRAFT_625977 [Colletotrichum godetiae]
MKAVDQSTFTTHHPDTLCSSYEYTAHTSTCLNLLAQSSPTITTSTLHICTRHENSHQTSFASRPAWIQEHSVLMFNNSSSIWLQIPTQAHEHDAISVLRSLAARPCRAYGLNPLSEIPASSDESDTRPCVICLCPPERHASPRTITDSHTTNPVLPPVFATSETTCSTFGCKRVAVAICKTVAMDALDATLAAPNARNTPLFR